VFFRVKDLLKLAAYAILSNLQFDMSTHRYFLVNKPFNMVSQFVSSHDVRLLGDLNFNFPEGTHAIGRLDQNSEGLLLLTTNKKITKLLFQGPIPHKRTYLVQVKNVMSESTAQQLAKGIVISAKNGTNFSTTPCEVSIVQKPKGLFEMGKPLHEKVLTSWVSITLTEGKFHQVRKMVAAVNHKCIRLIRIAIEEVQLGQMQPGEVKEIEEEIFFLDLKLA
jgi:23S rRNA pseudouridine2457 synthase